MGVVDSVMLVRCRVHKRGVGLLVSLRRDACASPTKLTHVGCMWAPKDGDPHRAGLAA